MAVKSVFQVEVDRGEWDKFNESYTKFRESLKQAGTDTKIIGAGFGNASAQISNAWRDLAHDSKTVAGHIASATASLLSWGGIIGGL